MKSMIRNFAHLTLDFWRDDSTQAALSTLFVLLFAILAGIEVAWQIAKVLSRP